MKSTLELRDGMSFEVDLEGHTFMVDAGAAVGGQDLGPSPKALLAPALGGCTAMDTISILRKMKQPVETLKVEVEAGLTEEHPKILKDVSVAFHVTGAVDPGRLWRAVSLSRDKYCGVAAMIRAVADVSYTVSLNGEDVPEP